MLTLLLALACSSKQTPDSAEPDPAADADTDADTDADADADADADTDADTDADSDTDADTDTDPALGTFTIAGTLYGSPFAADCSDNEITGSYTIVSGEVVSLAVGCADATDPTIPSGSVGFLYGDPGTYTTCAYAAGGAVVSVGTLIPTWADPCLGGSSEFSVTLDLVAPVDAATRHVMGSFHYVNAFGTTAVDGRFDLNATCLSGC